MKKTEGEQYIPCAVCQDLIPLVRDGVASDESAVLVHAHLQECAACRQDWKQYAAREAASAPDDARVVKRLRRSLAMRAVAFAVLGVCGCAAVLWSGFGPSYRLVWVLLAFGALGRMLLRSGVWAALSSTAAAMGVCVLIFADGGLAAAMQPANLWWAAGVALFGGVWMALGAAAAALIQFAVRTEKNTEALEEEEICREYDDEQTE